MRNLDRLLFHLGNVGAAPGRAGVFRYPESASIALDSFEFDWASGKARTFFPPFLNDRESASTAAGTACRFHHDADRLPHCSLLVARGWAYKISRVLGDLYDVAFIPGLHAPLEDARPGWEEPRECRFLGDEASEEWPTRPAPTPRPSPPDPDPPPPYPPTPSPPSYDEEWPKLPPPPPYDER